MKRIGIVAELGQETRVAATPLTVRQLMDLGYEVVVEKGAGEPASFPDDAYARAGALVVGADEAWGAEVVLRVNPPTEEEIEEICAQSEGQRPSDLRKHCARGGTRTGFQPLQTLGTPRNMPSAGQSGPGGEPTRTIQDMEVHSLVRLPDAVPGSAQLIEAEILPGTARTVAFRLLGASSGSAATVVSFDAIPSRLTLDRRNSGNTAFHDKFASVESAPVELDGGVLRLRVIVDQCSVEVFAQDGRVVLTDLVFPLSGNLRTDVCVEGGTAIVRKLAVTALS